MSIDLDALPTPDLGLRCMKCGYPLGGLSEHRCPECGTKFEYSDFIPAGDFPVAIVDGKEALLTPDVQDALRREKIPFMPLHSAVEDLYGISPVTMRPPRAGVGRSYYFEAIDLLRRLRDGVFALPPLDDSPDWDCPNCGENNPGPFEICWQCQTARPGDAIDKD